MGEASRQPLRILDVGDDLTLMQTVLTYLNENYTRAASATGQQEMLHHFGKDGPDRVILNLRYGEKTAL
jgi:hypothetical protein